jgi:hypothetical protein
MNSLLGYMLLIFISTILISLFYWQVIRPVLMQSLRYRLFARRDALRSLALDKIENCTSASYIYLETFICKAIAFMPTVSLVSFIFYFLRDGSKPSPGVLQFQKEASKHLEEIRDKALQDVLFMMMVNSPILVFFTAFITMLFWLSGKLSKVMLLDRAENFMGELQNDTSNGNILKPA